MVAPAERSAFYALRPGSWRDFVTLLHPPYTAWHLSYVALGAAAAPHVHAGRVTATLIAFLLAVGIAAHALDELHGRPLGTSLRRFGVRAGGRRADGTARGGALGRSPSRLGRSRSWPLALLRWWPTTWSCSAA
jgi:hypothetical protein